MPKSTGSHKIAWREAPDIEERIRHLVDFLELSWPVEPKIFCMRSKGAKTRAMARIWGLSRLWQMVLEEKPAYILEVIAERFDHLSLDEKDEVLIHELAHIPKNFSGSLLPHTRRRPGNFHDKLREMLIAYRRNQ